MESNNITENKKCKPNWTEDEKAIILEEYAKRKNTLQNQYNPSVSHLHKTKDLAGDNRLNQFKKPCCQAHSRRSHEKV